MFQDQYGDRTLDQVANVFGTKFAEELFKLRPGAWNGPVESGLGWHLVWVDSITPGRTPEFEEVDISQIKSQWLSAQRAETKRELFEAMRARYEIVLPRGPQSVAQYDLLARHPMNKAIRHPAWRYRLLINLFLGIIAFASAANAHESRPAYLEIDETAPGRYDVIWRTPLNAGMRLPIALKFSEGVSNVTEPAVRELPDSLVERRIIKVSDSIAGKRIDFVGLQATITDVLVRVRLLDGSESTTVARPSKSWVEITGSRGLIAVASSYALLGIEHIAFGIDHLLFVLALLIITNGTVRLLKTVTAFTIAHSITLALATLGIVHIPSRPVEATIALSIVFVAFEIIRLREGQHSITSRAPWIVAFIFGLLHGFGFAGALSEVGLPQNHIPTALFFFNVGVEVGQIAFISVVLVFIRMVRRLLPRAPRWTELIPPYAIGSVAMFWVVQRVAAF